MPSYQDLTVRSGASRGWPNTFVKFSFHQISSVIRSQSQITSLVARTAMSNRSLLLRSASSRAIRSRMSRAVTTMIQLSPERLTRVPEIPADGFVDVDKAHRLAIDEQDHVVRHVHGSAKAQQRFLASLALGDVPAYPAVAEETALGVEDRLAAYVGDLQLARCVEAVPLQVAERLMRFQQGAVRRPVGLGHVERGQFPAGLSDDRLRQGSETPVEIVGNHGEAEVLVLLPIPVRRELRQVAKALFALAQHFLGLLALHELSDLRADDVDRLHQALVRLADFAAVESENADHLSFRIHRKDECAVHARLDGDRLLPHARVARDVRDPHRLARLPHLSGQSDTRGVGDFARALDIQVELRSGLAPKLREVQSAAFVVDAEKAAALPVLRFANRADHRLERRRDAVGLGHRVRHRVLEPKQLVRALALGDAAREAAVSRENSCGVECRDAGRREKVLLAVLVDYSQVEIPEGLASVEQPAVLLPRSVERLLAELPARLSDYPGDLFGGPAAHEGPGKAVAGVLFPVPVTRQLGDGAKARFVFARPFAGPPWRGGVVAFVPGASGLSHACGHCRPARYSPRYRMTRLRPARLAR